MQVEKPCTSTTRSVDAWGGETAQYKWGFLGFYWLSGLLGSVAENAAIILATQQFPDRLGTVMASIGTVSGVGCMVGGKLGVKYGVSRSHL